FAASLPGRRGNGKAGERMERAKKCRRGGGGEPRRPYSKQCGSPARGVRLPHVVRVGGGRAYFRTRQKLPMRRVWVGENGDSRAATLQLCNIRVKGRFAPAGRQETCRAGRP